MIALDTYQDNLCLWRCIAVHHGARPDRNTTAARRFAKSFYKLTNEPKDVNKTSLDQLDDVERHLNRGVAFSDWLGIRVDQPESLENGTILWHLIRDSPAKLTNILTIGILKLAKICACLHCNFRCTKADHLQRHDKRCAQGKTVI